MHKKLELTGQVFNRVTVVARARILGQHSFWICRCSCDGRYSIIRGKSLTAKRIQSCGCLRKETSQQAAKISTAARTLPSGEASFNLLYAIYKFHAKRRKILFDLTKEVFGILTKSNCFYCGAEPSQVHRNRSCKGDYIYNGVDRQVNELGYIESNAVACCGRCNIMKSDWSVDEFLSACRTILKYQDQKRACSTQALS